MQQVRFDDSDKLKEMLSKVELFEDFSRYDLPKVAELCNNVLFFSVDEPIIEKGEMDDSFFVLLTGTARVCETLTSESLFTLEPGFIFGEISFLSNTERTKCVITNDNSFVLQLTGKMLQNLEPDMRDRIKDFLIKKLVGRIIQLESDS